MKKLLLISFLAFSTTVLFSQERRKKPTSKSSTTTKKIDEKESKPESEKEELSTSKLFFEINTGTNTTGNTGFALESTDGSTNWSIGGEAGYFIIPNLAAKVGLGIGGQSTSGDSSTAFNFKIGGKYYIMGNIPVGLDFTGSSAGGNTASWIGLQGGYTINLNDNLAIEPTLRYNLATKSKEEGGVSILQATVGFIWFL